MTRSSPAPVTSWLTERLRGDVADSVDRLRGADDVCHVALMPDLHLAEEVCVGAVVATERLIYPAAVGRDIGCGLAALAFDAEASRIDDPTSAARILAGLYARIPANKHARPRPLPASLDVTSLDDPRLQRAANRDGRVQLGTLGRGNHFLELQTDSENRLWVMIHSGSRSTGQAIARHHSQRALRGATGLKWLDADDEPGQAYLRDVEWACRYAEANRLAMLVSVEQLLGELFGIVADWNSLIHSDHNHVRREAVAGNQRWVHRKGAQSAAAGESGIVPGSMGAVSFHTAGQGCDRALNSCSHGAGRRLSRTAARRQVGGKELARQLEHVWFDHRLADRLRGEAPKAYKDVRIVMKAQRQLARTTRELLPVLSYKGDF